MSKFSFNEQSLYNKLWNSVEGRTILTYTVREIAEASIKPTYFPTAFSVSSTPILTQPSGVASFTVNAQSPEHSTMMDLVAPLGEGRLAEEGESASYSGSIGDFESVVWHETAPERKYKQELFEQLGDDAPLLQGFATDVLAPRIKAGYMSLDYMAIRAETTGKVFYDRGVGNKVTQYKADIPTENFCKAGAKAWTDPDCKLIDQMVAIEQKYVDLWGVDFSRQWKFHKDMFLNVVMKNQQVIETIKQNYLLAMGVDPSGYAGVSNFIVNEESFNQYVVAAVPGLSPIRVVDAKQMDNGKVVDPWENGVAILCPAGYAGEILRTDMLENKMYTSDMLNDLMIVNSATTANGLMSVFNYVKANGFFKEWYTKVRMSAVPVLKDFLYRVIVDTTTAE